MKKISGIAASKGYAIGECFIYQEADQEAKEAYSSDTQFQLERLKNAKQTALLKLNRMYHEAVEKVGEEHAEIFKVHQMLLEDEDFGEAITYRITEEGHEAAYAVAQTGLEFEAIFREMDNEYMNERAADIRDISGRLVRILTGTDDDAGEQEGIMIASDLTPSQTLNMDKSKIRAIVTEEGSAMSHSAILARTIGIPAVAGARSILELDVSGTIIVDGFEGCIYIDPDAEMIDHYRRLKLDYDEQQALLQAMKGLPTVTRDDIHIELCCNIGNVDDVEAVLENDGEGIGLFRTEFLYMQGEAFPTEKEQYEAYKTVLEKMAPRRVIVRTLDLGADKHVGYFELDKEENPAMGYRAIRICLDRQEIFRDQIRALLRASVYGRLGIMFPMIISLEEVLAVKAFVENEKQQLINEGVYVSDSIELGIMIETPAAVMATDLLAQEVDFFSIGTNDLTQYTLAVDRMNPKVAGLYNSRNLSVLRMIKMTVDQAHRYGTWVGICGESAADQELLGLYLSLGIDELSVTPKSVLELRQKIRDTHVEQIREKELHKWL